MRTLTIGWLFARSRAGVRTTSILPVVAFGIATTLLLTVAAGAQAFFSWHDDSAIAYQLLAVIALALLVVPLLSLGGAAARLAARRRDDRLATLRLLGATTTTVASLTVLESALLAIIGAVAGIAGYAVLTPLVALIPFRGAGLGLATLWLSPLAVAGVVAGVASVAVLSAVIGLRSVVVTPLGVRTKQSAPGIRWIRVVLGAAIIVLAVAAMQLVQVAGSLVVIAAILAAGFGGTAAMLSLVGPFVIRAFASRQARRAQHPARLIAARSILESPKAAWRQVGGVAMTSFLAVFAGVGLAVANLAQSSGSMDAESRELFTDIRTGVFLTLAISFLMVACSVAITQAAAIFDRRDLYTSLDRLGMPVSMMDAARRRAVMSPLRIVSIGSALCAAVVVLPLSGIALVVAPLSLAVIAGCIAAGISLVWLGLRSTHGVLTRVIAQGEAASPE